MTQHGFANLAEKGFPVGFIIYSLFTHITSVISFVTSEFKIDKYNINQ